MTTLQAGSQFGGRYRVERLIAKGGMGAVYEVTHYETQRRRALKVMHPHICESAELRDRFKAEARVAAQIDSDFIVDVFDAGVDEATTMPFLVMELLRGEELGQRLARVGRFAPEEALSYLWQTALALEKTHKASIVHRDLKPENLFLTLHEDGHPRIKVLDFGVAKFVAETAMKSGTTRSVGTPIYMSPEQFRGQRVTPACDNYALGMVAYTLLVGEAYWAEEVASDVDVVAFALLATTGLPEPSLRTRAASRGRVPAVLRRVVFACDGGRSRAPLRFRHGRDPGVGAGLRHSGRRSAPGLPGSTYASRGACAASHECCCVRNARARRRADASRRSRGVRRLSFGSECEQRMAIGRFSTDRNAFASGLRRHDAEWRECSNGDRRERRRSALAGAEVEHECRGRDRDRGARARRRLGRRVGLPATRRRNVESRCASRSRCADRNERIGLVGHARRTLDRSDAERFRRRRNDICSDTSFQRARIERVGERCIRERPRRACRQRAAGRSAADPTANMAAAADNAAGCRVSSRACRATSALHTRLR